MIQLWPTRIDFSPVASASVIRRLNKELLRDIVQIRAMDGQGQSWSRENYVGGYTSYSSIDNVHLRFAPFMELKKWIDKKVKHYVSAQKWDLDSHKLKMDTCWINVMPALCHHSLHLHPNSTVSGTYYVQVPKGSGLFKLEDPRLGLMMSAPAKKASAPAAEQAFYSIQPKPGHVVLFESWLRHEVTANRGQGLRVSISFNYS